jgi:hypothetical protein
MHDVTNGPTTRASGQPEAALAGIGLPLEELVRRGARDIIPRAIEAEVQVLLAQCDEVRLRDGSRAVVRNGTLPEPEILTAVGPAPAQVPKVRDRSCAGVKLNAALSPPSVRRPVRDQGAGVGRTAVAVPQGHLQRRSRRRWKCSSATRSQGAFAGRFGASEGSEAVKKPAAERILLRTPLIYKWNFSEMPARKGFLHKLSVERGVSGLEHPLAGGG